MPKISLKKMSVAQLVAMRDEIQSVLSERIERERTQLQKQIDALATLEVGSAPSRRSGRAGPIAKGRATKPAGQARQPKRRAKVAPKYRGPNGETWTGRGLAPRWLVALEAQGKKRESLLIKK